MLVPVCIFAHKIHTCIHVRTQKVFAFAVRALKKQGHLILTGLVAIRISHNLRGRRQHNRDRPRAFDDAVKEGFIFYRRVLQTRRRTFTAL